MYYDMGYDGEMMGWEISSMSDIIKKIDNWWAEKCADSDDGLKPGYRVFEGEALIVAMGDDGEILNTYPLPLKYEHQPSDYQQHSYYGS